MKKKGSFLGLVPLLIFLLIYASTGIFTDKIDNMPLLVAFTITVAIALCFNNPNKEKISFEQKVEIFCKGASDSTLLLLVIIFLLAGAFYSVADAMGAVKSMVNLGLTLLPLKMLLPGLFIIGCILSFAMGTSMGTVSALTPIAVGIANETGISLPLICGVVVGGAMFGDNLSVISDTTIAATKTQGVEMKDKFRINLYIALPAAILTIILLFFFARPDVIPEAVTHEYNLVKVFPYIFVLVMALAGVNVFVVLTSGILLSGIIGFIYGDFTLLGYGKEIYNGFTNMTEIFVLSLLTGGMAQMVTRQGGIQWVIDTVQKFIVGKKSAKVGVGLLVSLADIAVANNTVAIIITGGISKKISEKNNVDLRESAAILDIFSCIFQGLIPYGAQMLILLGFAGDKVAPTQLIPLLWYQLLLGIFTLIYIFVPQISKKALSILDKNIEKK